MIAEKEYITEFTDGKTSAVKIEGIEHFLVSQTFDCGQCFRFDPVPSPRHACEFEGVAYGRYVRFAQDRPDELIIYGATKREYKEIWKKYLGLDLDYGEVKRDLLARCDSDALRCAVEYGGGIRILRQEPWETVCSFIVSQNNNIPRIKKIIAALSRELGERIDGGHFAFPTPEAICGAGVDLIFSLKTGFRAKYILDAAEKASSGALDFEKIRSAPSEEAEAMLCAIKGVGPKVANCAMLFGFEKYEAFPIDVWVKRILAKYFTPDFDPACLGKWAGIAQQYLFYYERYLGGK